MKYIRLFFASLVILFMIAVAVGYIMYRKADIELYSLEEAARKNIPGSFIRLSDGITHYELAGPDTCRLVVLVHGFSVPYYIWDSTFSRLVSEGFKVLRYDEFGRGFSDRPDKVYEASLYRQQLSELLDKLNLHAVYAIAGVSFGGAVSADFVVHNAGLVTKVILIDPVYPALRGSSLPYPEWFARYKMSISPDDVVNGQLTDLKYPDQFPHWADQYKVQMRYKGFRNALVSTRFHYGPVDIILNNYHELDSLQKSVLLIWGKEDITVPFKYADSLRRLLHTGYLPVDDARHLPQMEQAKVVNEKIISFLKAG